ncbi:hypothetical protein HCMG_00143 [Helicobacter canadensis MIT 98-5491]|nr:hypothetical protein HCMG_00143 [Helicobacter canadensis MIT 98-5491]
MFYFNFFIRFNFILLSSFDISTYNLGLIAILYYLT